MPDNGTPERQTIELLISDQAQLRSLREWLREQQGVEIIQTEGSPGQGEQGALDTLTVLASSGGLIATIRVLPEFIRSRRVGFHIETTIHGEKFILDAANADGLLPVLERLFDA